MATQKPGEGDSAAGLPADPFWDFSLEVYGRPGVAESLLALQNRRGLDVNLLLFCLWCGRSGRTISVDEMTLLEARIKLWREEVVAVLRRLRRHLKVQSPLETGGRDLLRAKILDAELFAEAIAQRALRHALGAFPAGDLDRPEVALQNLRVYWDNSGLEAEPRDLEDLTSVLRGLWPKMARDDLRQHF